MKLGELAAALGLELQGDAEHWISRLAPLSRATADELAFAVDGRHRQTLEHSAAGAVITTGTLARHAHCAVLVAADPYASYAEASWLLQPESAARAGIHASAIVAPDAEIADTAEIGAGVVVDSGVKVESGAIIGALSTLGANCVIGAGTRLFPRVTVYHNCRIGTQCRVQSGAVIGAEGFGYAFTDHGWQAIQQSGAVRIGNRVHVGANTTIDRGALDDTVIADGVILDNQIQIAHNVEIGENTAIAGCVGIAGSTRIGRHCRIGGACNIVGHLSIADGVTLNAASLVTRSITRAGHYASGLPLQEASAWRRTFVSLGRLDALFRRVRRLERSD